MKNAKEKSLLSVKIPKEVHKQIQDYSDERGIFIKKFVELAALEYMKTNPPKKGYSA